MPIPSVNTSAFATKHSLDLIANNKKFTFTKNKQGAIEVSLKKLGLWETIKNWFNHSQRKLANSFIDQTLKVVDANEVNKNLRKEILSKVTSQNKTTDLFNSVIKKAHAEKKSGDIQAKFSSALNHIIETRSHKKEGEAFITHFNRGVPVTLFDSRPYVEYYWEQKLKGEGPNEAFYKSVRTYFADSHQASGFEEIEVQARKAVFANFSANLPVNRGNAELCKLLVKDIQNKAKEQPSIHGHPRDLYTLEDVENLKVITATFPPTTSVYRDAEQQLKKIDVAVTKSNVTLKKYSSLFQRLESGKQTLPLIVEAKNALMEIELLAGRYNSLDLLRSHPGISEKNKKGIEKLMTFDQMRGENIDDAMLQSFIREHGEAIRHPRVAIEGAGPVGLLLAMTQLRSGANVSIFEKRSTLFDRTQIVRLDPKWMAMLKFYLGEDYYKLFIDAGKKGILREDGFGEISTRELEDALHIKLTKLISLIPAEKGKIPALERLAAHEIVQVNPPAVKGGKFQIVADYEARFDIAKGPKEPSPEHQVREVDMMICAGGKSSPMKDKFLPSSVPVNNKQNYGVCSWLATKIPGQDPVKMDLFQDFRNMIKVDQDFRNRFQTKLQDGFVGVKANEHLLRGFYSQLKSPKFQEFMRNGPAQAFIQTRTFENLGLIYIGMEIPTEVNELFKDFEDKLDQVITKGDQYLLETQKRAQDSQSRLEALNLHLEDLVNPQATTYYSRIKNDIEAELKVLHQDLETRSPGHTVRVKEKQFLMERMRKMWFQNVMDTYGLTQKNDLSMDKIDTKFAAFFPVDQNRLEQHNASSIIKSGSSELLILAAGDAFASPHFMRYSGLTGGRENILDYQNYTRHMTRDLKPDQQKLLNRLRFRGDRTAAFVIDRGKAFLTSKTDQEIAKARKDKIIAMLDKEVADTTVRPYTIKKVRDGVYEAQKGFQSVTIRPQEGYLRVVGSPQYYQSFEQIKLERQLQ